MTDVIDYRLPQRIASGFKGGPEWQTRVTTLRNGHEVRNRDWLFARYRYTANFGAFTAVDRQELIGVFHAAAGKHKAFRFRDPTDYFVTSEPLTVPASGMTPVQLARAYTFGPSTSVAQIQAPVSGTVVIYKNGTAFPVSVDYLTGLVTPVGGWETGVYTFDCQYDRWVRFDSDWGAFTATTPGIWTADIDLVEVPR